MRWTPVNDLDGLEYATRQLHTVILPNNRVDDLSPLAQCPLVARLVSDNPIRDLRPLANMGQLKELDLARTDVRDLGPLAGLPALTRLNLRGTPVRDLSPIADLPALTELPLGATPLDDNQQAIIDALRARGVTVQQ